MKPSSHPTLRGRIFGGVFLAWMALVFFHYFSLKTALDPAFLYSLGAVLTRADSHKLAENWLNFLKNLSCAVAVSFVLWRLGRRLLRWMGVGQSQTALRFCLEMALGIIAANTFWLGLGFNGLWWDPLLWGIGLVWLGWALWDFSRNFLKIQKFPRVPIPGKFFILLGFLGALGLALDILQGITPDVYYDALVYHLSTLQFWKFHHGVADFYTNLYSYYPFGGELYFLNGFFFAGSEAAKLLNAFCAGFCGLAAAGWVMEEAGIEQGLLTWTMVLALPLVSATVWTTQNDVVLAFFLTLFFYTLLRWAQGPQAGPWALAAGLLGGAALTIKYTAVVAVVMGVLAMICISPPPLRGEGRGEGGSPIKGIPKKALVIFGLIVFSIAPWLLKNVVFTGNPVYPYLSSVIGGRALPVENMKALMNDHEAVFNGSFSLGAWTARLFGTDLDKTIAPLLFGFIPFLPLGGKRRPRTRHLLLLSAFLLLSGFLISYQLRLMVPALIVCFVAMAMVLSDVGWKGATMAWGGAVALFGVLSLLSLARLSVNYYQTHQMALGVETREEYLASVPPTASYYVLAQATGDLLPPDACLLVAGDARGLYYPRPFYANSVFDAQVMGKLARKAKDGAGIWKRLREMGIDALAVSGEEGRRIAGQSTLDAITPEEEVKLDDLLQHWTDPLFFHGLDGLYRLRDSSAPPRPPIHDLLKLLEATDKTN